MEGLKFPNIFRKFTDLRIVVDGIESSVRGFIKTLTKYKSTLYMALISKIDKKI
jgi:hypothetical protein